MHTAIRSIIESYKPILLSKLDNALRLRVTNFRRDLFPSLEEIDLAIPGAGFQYVIWIEHEPKYPFPGWEFDPIARPMRYIPTYLASGMNFIDVARAVAWLSGGHVEDCVKAYCDTLDPPLNRHEIMPLGTLVRQPRMISSLGLTLSQSLSEIASVLVNKAKHDFALGTPRPVISFPDALGGYFASRILGCQVLQLAGILDKYVTAIRKAFSEGIVYTMPSGQDPGNDDNAWPLQSSFSEPEVDPEEF